VGHGEDEEETKKIEGKIGRESEDGGGEWMGKLGDGASRRCTRLIAPRSTVEEFGGGGGRCRILRYTIIPSNIQPP
jgi:hypothetical protein